MIDPKAIYFIQNTLDGLGYNPGPLDNVLGPLTLSSVATLKEAAVKPDVLAFQQCLVQVGAWTTPFVAPTGRFGPITQASWDAVVQFSKGGDALCLVAPADNTMSSGNASAQYDPAPTVPPAGAGQPHNRILTAPGIPWSVEVDGDDLVVRNVTATAFGGGYDAGDSGDTESGVKNDGSNLTLMGCALPIRSTEAATKGSPLAFRGPHIPWGTQVKVWYQGIAVGHEEPSIIVSLLDNGPNTEKFPSHALDLTVFAASHFTQLPTNRIANEWEKTGMSYRVLGGAKWVS